jgi:pimeloyl-ACP methyl ester carboxylesterase
MTDRPVLIPTAEGAVGGIVSAPPAEPRAAMVLLPGYGRPARSGANSFWTRVARSLADLGVLTLRVDYSREGETIPIGVGGSGQAWKRDLDLRLLDQVLSWYRRRLGADVTLFLGGACSGGRLAIELAGRHPEAVAETFLVVPYLRSLPRLGTEGTAEATDLDPVDPAVVDCMRRMLARGPCWTLTGEKDDFDLFELRRRLGATPHELQIEVAPDVILHFLDQPHLQETTERWLLARVGAVLPSPSGC